MEPELRERTRAFLRRLRDKAKRFKLFLYNPQTREVLGRTLKSWGQICGFFMVFYSVIGGIFAAHLALFIHITPEPAEDVQPWNFGRYAYPNYPNAKIVLITVPRRMRYNGNRATLSNGNRRAIEHLLSSANQSGVSDHCLDEGTRYGYSEGEPCVFIRVQKVMEWSPALINESLSEAALLPISCEVDSSFSDLQVNISAQPAGLPLTLNNNKGSRSFPYRNQDNYIYPVMAVMLNLTSASGLPSRNRFELSIVCSVDYLALGWGRPSHLNRVYEIPKDARTTVQFRL